MTKPVDLLIANELHNICEGFEKAQTPEQIAAGFAADQRGELAATLARGLLCMLAHKASLTAVAKALEALGVEHGEALVQRLQAVHDQRVAEGIAAPYSPRPSPAEIFKALIEKIDAATEEAKESAPTEAAPADQAPANDTPATNDQAA